MAAPSVPADIAKLSFEDALAELEQIVSKLEAGKAKLDDAIKSYERGVLLKQHCEAKLREAQMKVEQIQLQPDGSLSAKPLDAA
jgi:exodeoxyribonuclease VII small subunit